MWEKMREKIRKKLQGKRQLRAVALGAFAAILAFGAVTGQNRIEAAKTNTGAPGSTTVSSIKNFGGGNFVSDYQGAYFYILPCTYDMVYNADDIFTGTLFTTNTKDENGNALTYRDIYETLTYRDIYEQTDQPSVIDYMKWGSQYTLIKQQGYTAVPPQTSKSLMFVPYTTHNGTALQEGWKANISSICYYDANGETVDDQYHITTSSKYMNNRIFAPAYNDSKFDSYCKSGVFYETLAKWTADTDKKLEEDDLDIKKIRSKFSSKTAIKNFVASKGNLQTDGYNLWCYILSLDESNGTLNFNASQKIEQFLTDGYNSNYAKRNKAYSSTNLTGVGLSSGLSGKYKLNAWTDGNANSDVFAKNKFAQREYCLHSLDLMLCAYAAAVKQGASSEVTNEWLDVIYNYVQSSGNTTRYSTTVPIAICGGTIARGADQTSDGKTTNRIVYVGTQDLVNFAEQLENAGAAPGAKGSNIKVNSRSVTKTFLGPRIGGTGSDKTHLMAIVDSYGFENGNAYNLINEEVFKFGTKGVKNKTVSGLCGYKITTIKKLPDYYTSYYARLKSAMKGGEVGKVKNLESTSASEIQSWHSNVVLRAVINTMYTRDKNGNVTEVKAKSDFRETIKLVRQKGYPANENVMFQYGDCWGAMYVPSYMWPKPDASEEASFGVVLTARSSLYAQAQKGNTTASYKDVAFPSPGILTSKTDKTITWKDNHDNKNDRKDILLATRELEDNDTEAEAFQNNKETVQLEAQVVYLTEADKKRFKTWYQSVDQSNLKVKMTVTPLYGQKITTAKGKEVPCQSKWNTSYTGSAAKTISVALDNGSGTSVKLLNADGCKVSKDVFEAIFLPESGLEGTKLILDTDSAFFKNTGFDVPQSKDGEKTYAYIGYQVTITATGVKTDGSKEKITEDGTSNKAGISYSRTVKPDKNGENSLSNNYTSIPENYSELKEGSVLNEQFEAMAGVPSTRSLYFSTGGSEFIVNVRCNYEANQKAERTYHSHYNGTDCEYKKGDQLKGLSAGGQTSETFVGDASGKTISKNVQCEKNNNVNPTGASSYDTSTKVHTTATTITATWTGTIGNNTPEPADVGTFDPGKPGTPCAAVGYDPGKQRTKATASTNWDVSAYNNALSQAFSWAKQMETISKSADGNAWRIADSDGMKRIYHVGDAVITVTMSGGSKACATECGSSASFSKNGSYTSSQQASATVQSNDSGVLGSGWSYTAGKYGKGSGYVAGHGHGASCPGNDKQTGEDAEGNPIMGPCGIEHNCGTFTPGTDYQHGASASISYTIKVTFKNGYADAVNYDGTGVTSSKTTVGTCLPAHALCGPCCEHTLPAIEDKWTQIVWFDTMSITDMQVWKLESGYVQGISEITEGNRYYAQNQGALATINDIYDSGTDTTDTDNDLEDWETVGAAETDEMVMNDRLYAAITQADPNIFYNIAAKNVEEGKGAYNTSKVGRLRYSLQTGQDDTVYYEEKNEKGELHRSNKCDGMASTKSKNPAPDGGTGHKDQPWATGCLYSNTTFVNGVDYHKTMTSSLKTGYNTQTLTEKKTDTVDVKSEEWKRFDKRRNQQVSVTVISDFLILQTSSGDQSVLYYEGKSKTVKAQENFGEVDVDTDKSNATGYAKFFTNNPLAMKQGTAINVGSYNGNYNTPETKYKGSGNGQQIATAFDNDRTSYNSLTDELGLAQVKAARTITSGTNRNVSCPGASQERLPRVNGLIITRNPVIQCPTNVNKEYTTGLSYAFYKPLVKYSDNGTRYSSATLDADNKEQEKMRDNPNSTDSKDHKKYTKLTYTKKAYGQAGYTRNKTELLENEIARTGAVSADQEEESRYLKALGKEYYGILLRSIYTRGKTKCNDIVVHDPVSTELVRIMRLDSQGDDLDQRTTASILEAGSAKDLNDAAAEEGKCPGTPGECNFRELHCKYGQEIVRAAFTVDAYNKMLITDEEDESSNTSNKTYTEDDYSYSIFSSVINDNGSTPSFTVNGTGFLIRSEGGDIPPENQEDIPAGTNYWLRGTGKASMPFAFYKMSIDSSNTAERVKIGANIKVNKVSRMPIISTEHTHLFVEADGYLSIETDDGAKYRSVSKVYTTGAMHRIELSICFGTISDFSVNVDGTTVTFNCTNAPSVVPYEQEVCGPEFFLGNSESGTKYDVDFSADNIQVTRLAGTTTHTDACYKTTTVHSATVQNTYNGIQGDTIDWIGTEDDGSNRITSENNYHAHTDSCLTEGSEGYGIAYEKGVAGDTTYLEKMAGAQLWSQIVKDFELNKDAEGNYTLSGGKTNSEGSNNIEAGKTFDYAYTGSVQEITLPAGTYQLETWGAQGGSNTTYNNMIGKSGGYVKGTLTLDETTTLYIVVGGKGGDRSSGIDGYNSLNNNGGYNGGGSGSGSAGPGGGGATHIATSSTVLSSNGGTTSSISGLIMIAGGGGAGSSVDGTYGNYSYMNGQNAYTGYSGSYPYDNGGGGAGYKGGATVSGDDSRTGYSGSSYVSTNLTDTSMQNSQNTGNGKARITVLSVKEVAAGDTYEYGYTGSVNKVTLPAGTYQLETWGAQGGSNNGASGGKGGYSAGILQLDTPTTINIYVGGTGSVNAGGYNGGGTGGTGYGTTHYGAGGGGATHMATATGLLSSLSSNKDSVLIVAPGGGGAGGSSQGGSTSYGSGVLGGAGGAAGMSGNKGNSNGYGYGGNAATTTAGGAGGGYQSYSSSSTDGTYYGAGGGGAGGGWYGGGGGGTGTVHGWSQTTAATSGTFGRGGNGGVSTTAGYSAYYAGSGGGGGGGIGYVKSTLTNTALKNGNIAFTSPEGLTETGHSGAGYAKITVLTVKNKGVDKDELFAFIKAHKSMIPDTVTTNGHTIMNPIWDCKCAYDMHKCTGECKKIRELKCTEPHHEGKHYDYSSQICYDACCRDENHKQYQTEVTDKKGNVIQADNFILLDNYFDVYFPNVGNFQGIGSYGIPDTQIERGIGYTAGMDTTEWTREKWIKFPYSVLYNRNGVWEEHSANEWFQIEIFDTDGSTLSTYHFYCQLKNDEMGSGEVEYAVEAINHETYPGDTEKMTTTGMYHERHQNAVYPYEKDDLLNIYAPTDGTANTNRERGSLMGSERYWAYEDSWNHTFIDVIGRIGNLIVDDTDDLRFTNLFKKTTDEGWLIDGILKTVDPASPSHYMSWWKNDGTTAVDIRGEKVCKENEWYNTYQTQAWTNEAGSVAIPLQANKNTVTSLKNAANELRLGYNVLWDISSIGNYENGTLQVIPYYYALNIKTGALTPVDVYIDSGNQVQPINYFHLVDDLANSSEGTEENQNAKALADTLYSYNMTLNWSKESGRRNYSSLEKDHTESLASDNTYGSFAYDANGNMVMRPVTLYNEENGTYTAGETPLVYNLTIPYGDMDFVLGTEQLLYISCEPTATSNDGGRARTFIGSSTVTALGNDINGKNETNLSGTSDKDYWVRGQRWHVTLGLPSTAEFVAYRGGKHTNPNELITVNNKTMYARDEFKPDDSGACDYVVLMTADIKVLGDVYNLSYSQGTNNGVFRASNGNTFRFSDDIPTILGIYGIGDTNTPDLDIMQTH